jgi:hypothetical protein
MAGWESQQFGSTCIIDWWVIISMIVLGNANAITEYDGTRSGP